MYSPPGNNEVMDCIRGMTEAWHVESPLGNDEVMDYVPCMTDVAACVEL